MASIVECVPNFSEGIDQKIIESIVEEVRKMPGARLLDYSSDSSHNRTVVTFVGTKEVVEETAFNLIKKASEVIDMSTHSGEHPRMGATDVFPFIPIKDATMEECIEISKRVGKRVGDELSIPVYLYEESTSSTHRKNLAKVRKGQYEGFFEKINEPDWKPDFGPTTMNRKSGVVAMGGRFPLVAYNVNLATDDLEVASLIAKKVRHIGGGLRFVKAIGIKLEDRNITQVSMNLVNFEKTAIYRAHEMVKMEAKRYGVPVIGGEVIGLVPIAAIVSSLEYYMQLENFKIDQVLEYKLSEQ